MGLDCLYSIKELCNELHDLYISNTVRTIPSPTEGTLLNFYREFVAKNNPVKIRDCITHWRALDKWSNDYLVSVLTDTLVTTAITPNGLADAVVDGKFTLPFETQMPFHDFCTELSSPQDGRVLYLQKQNSSFTDEFAKLMDDVDPELWWASQAFGTTLDAVNFWMGDGRAITSLHKDPYENIYCVVRGSKTFTLFPPTDRVHMRYREYPVWIYDGEGALHREGDSFVQWLDVNQRNPLLDTSLARDAHPLTVTVNAGETLYIPSYWFHHVRQAHGTIAVNYWYDIDYGPSYGLYSTLDWMVKCWSGQDNVQQTSNNT